LFLPTALRSGERLVIAEGPTDTAAILGLGFQAVGRPSCEGGVQQLVRLVRRLHVADVVIAADRDPPGQRGAARLADVLVQHAPVRVITPPEPAKDMREWIARGKATVADVALLIDAAPLRHLHVVVSPRHGAGS
jgi:DNA primase